MPGSNSAVLHVAENCWQRLYGSSTRDMLPPYPRMRRGARTSRFPLTKITLSPLQTGALPRSIILFVAVQTGVDLSNCTLEVKLLSSTRLFHIAWKTYATLRLLYMFGGEKSCGFAAKQDGSL